MQLPPDPSRPLRQWDPPDRRVLALSKQHRSVPGDLAPWKQPRLDRWGLSGQE